MSLYVVTAARFDEHGEIESVLWVSANGTTRTSNEEPYPVPVDRVIEAFDHGDIVEMRFPTPGGYVSGGQLLRKVLASGYENLREERGDAGRTLRDLPSY